MNMVFSTRGPQSDALSPFRCMGQSGWCCFLFSPLCVLLSPPGGCCSLLQRWTSTGSLLGGVFFNNSRCSICLSDLSRLKSSSYTLSCSSVKAPDRISMRKNEQTKHLVDTYHYILWKNTPLEKMWSCENVSSRALSQFYFLIWHTFCSYDNHSLLKVP